MKYLDLGIFAVLAWILSTISAQQYSLANATTCGLACVAVTVPKINCPLLNTACQCKSTELPQLMTACLLENCTMHDGLSKRLPFATSRSICCADCSDCHCLHVHNCVGRLASDIQNLGVSHYGHRRLDCHYCSVSKVGFGRHIWDLQDGDLSLFLKYFYIVENAYVISITLTKISVIFLYLRLFEHSPSFRYTAYGTIVFIALITVVLSSLTIFACQPVSFFWDRDIRGGKCLDIKAVAYAISTVGIVEDLVIVALPLPLLVKLQMSTRKKIGIGFMLILGSIGCVVSMIRLKSLISFGNSLDPSWDNVNAVVWTILELSAAMICASLPALRVLLLKLFPKSILSTTGGTFPTNGREPQPKPWQGIDFGRRSDRYHSSATGFVELERTISAARADQAETPPTPPPKDNFVIELGCMDYMNG
ncbi:uncharacterized protein K444DRAFT_633723 [Hyaloscypha bicolor E]|uniref:Uncharacterized protein n=1 Tax=Hyaloscypha bicolor E TaxID=1095630 RepID=A0A2J6SVL8_9HELO|nr:uncharacterized protein K444DRAFT_633723 [Hyaloscypha bicolor E]PMD54820.1 hypothetical protein K444DRAFT_633723 [Hyaloscypha bicolor E]